VYALVMECPPPLGSNCGGVLLDARLTEVVAMAGDSRTGIAEDASGMPTPCRGSVNRREATIVQWHR
jgi:hypothetical protein